MVPGLISVISRANASDTRQPVNRQMPNRPGKMVAIVQVLQKFGLREVARTGKIALTRESGVNTELLKSLEAAKFSRICDQND